MLSYLRKLFGRRENYAASYETELAWQLHRCELLELTKRAIAARAEALENECRKLREENAVHRAHIALLCGAGDTRERQA